MLKHHCACFLNPFGGVWSACGKRPCAVGRYGQQSIVNDFRTGEKGGGGGKCRAGVLTPKGLIAARTTKQCTRRFLVAFEETRTLYVIYRWNKYQFANHLKYLTLVCTVVEEKHGAMHRICVDRKYDTSYSLKNYVR